MPLLRNSRVRRHPESLASDHAIGWNMRPQTDQASQKSTVPRKISSRAESRLALDFPPRRAEHGASRCRSWAAAALLRHRAPTPTMVCTRALLCEDGADEKQSSAWAAPSATIP
jgi:hypothetical protein